ncbi:MAG: hypothetical protein V1858_00010 [Candidatus Gottesmanbacteria bacterium]
MKYADYINSVYNKYNESLRKLILLCILVGIILGFGFFFRSLFLPFALISWYVLFPPSNMVIFIGFILSLAIAFVFNLAELTFLTEYIDIIIYLLLVFSIINLLKVKEKPDLE